VRCSRNRLTRHFGISFIHKNFLRRRVYFDFSLAQLLLGCEKKAQSDYGTRKKFVVKLNSLIANIGSEKFPPFVIARWTSREERLKTFYD
jgi:hypothetical protein